MAMAPPGWYPDPADARSWRWWDGSAWTDHVHDPSLKPLTQQREAAGYLRNVVWLQLPISLLGVVVNARIVDFWRDLDFSSTTPSQPSLPVWVWFVSPLGLVITAMIILWVLRVAETGRALVGPGRRSPLLAALSVLIPIVNYWWPCQSVRDAVPGDPHARQLVLRWWLTYLGASLAAPLVGFAVPFLPRVVAVAAVALVAGAAILAIITTRDATHAVLVHHEKLVVLRSGNPPAQ